MDESAITVNLCLGKDFTGGQLVLHEIRSTDSESSKSSDMSDTVIEQVPGVAVMHVGQHYHSVLPLTSGERMNLVLWMQSSHFNSSPAERFVNRECMYKNFRQPLHFNVTTEL